MISPSAAMVGAASGMAAISHARPPGPSISTAPLCATSKSCVGVGGRRHLGPVRDGFGQGERADLAVEADLDARAGGQFQRAA